MASRLPVAACLLLCIVCPHPAAGQSEAFLEGLDDFSTAMLALPANRERVDAALRRMERALASNAATRPGGRLLDDRTPAPVLPLQAYADGFAKLRSGDLRAAVAALRRGLDTPDDERGRLVAAAALAQQGQLAEAERALRGIRDAYPASAVTRWWLARVHESLDRPAEARREYEAILPVAIGGRGTLYAAIGRLARLEGDYATAAAALTRRVEITPDDAAARKDLARILHQQDRHDAALAELNAALRLDAMDADVYTGIGQIHLEAGRPGEAVSALSRAVELTPERYETRYALATALRQAGRADAAAAEMRIFQQAMRDAISQRRRTFAADVQREEAAREDRGR